MKALKKGNQGQEVISLQHLLIKHGFFVKADGDFGNKTFNAVKAFQSQNLDKHGRPLIIDGAAGPLTWWALQSPVKVSEVPHGIDYSKLPSNAKGISGKALQIAIDELNLGAKEIGGNNSGPWVSKYLNPAGLIPPQNWCASFVSYCYMKAAGSKENMPFRYSPGAKDILSQMKKKGWVIPSGTDPEPGDIVVWWRVRADGWQGHIGLVHHTADGFIYTIEGNKSSKVQGFHYVKSNMEKLLGFARIAR